MQVPRPVAGGYPALFPRGGPTYSWKAGSTLTDSSRGRAGYEGMEWERGGYPWGLGKESRPLMPALLLDTPNPCLKMGNPFQGKEIPYFSPQCQLPQLPMLKQPASTDHSQFRLSSFLRHIWAELHVHGAVRDHSKIDHTSKGIHGPFLRSRPSQPHCVRDVTLNVCSNHLGPC